ncbi:MAG TPA: YqeG family HAD IIIA-type phosphatase [Clostridiales bacterium]|nr:YqeG family HAD IIIA-type phosphatase [Clostridiales bacterium]
MEKYNIQWKSFIKRLLTPTMKYKDIYSIDFTYLHVMGYRNIILDVDNTLVIWDMYEINPKLFNQIQYIKDMGFKICLLSNNNNKKQISELADQLLVLTVFKGKKPFSRSFNHALEALEADIENTLVIGDQIFTDILGGNMMGLTTILVDPLSKKEFITTKFMRLLEKTLMGRKIEYDNK